MAKTFDDLRNGVVLAELGGYGDGPYCARHGAGAALVMLGTYIVDPGPNVPYPPRFVFEPGRSHYAAYLAEHVAAARASGAKVGVSAISVKLEDTLDFLLAAEEAGADYASLCAHSVMEMFVREGLGEALCYLENRAELARWAEALVQRLRIPVIFKIGFANAADTAAAIDTMAATGVALVHVNLGACDAGSEGLVALPDLATRCSFVIAGGGIADADGARRVLDAGASAVAVGTAAMKDPAFCGRLQQELRSQSKGER